MDKIAVIEDEVDLVENLVANLELEGFSAYGFRTAEDFLWRYKEIEPDVLLVDRNLPGQDGLTLVKEIRSKLPNVSILFVTARIEASEAVEGLRAGADDYIRKPFSTAELIERIRKCCQLRRHKDSSAKNDKKWKLDKKSRDFHYEGHRIHLTQTEVELLGTLLKSVNQVVDRQKLSQCFSHLNINDSRALDVHISSIRKKISPMGFQIETVRGVGYRVLLPST